MLTCASLGEQVYDGRVRVTDRLVWYTCSIIRRLVCPTT
jgi:hypothetical protein